MFTMSLAGLCPTSAFSLTPTPRKQRPLSTSPTCMLPCLRKSPKLIPSISFDGEVVAPEVLEDPEKRKTFDLMGFIGRNSKDLRQPEIEACAKELKSQYKKVGAIGFCYGGWAVFRLGAKGKNLIDCVSTAHPSLLEKSEMENLAVPTQILAPETDPQFTPELKEFANKTIPALGIDYQYDYYPGV